MNDRLSDALEKVKSQMTDPDSIDKPTEETEMSASAESVSSATRKTPRKKTTNGAAKPKAKRVAKTEDGMLSLAALSKELKIEPRLARMKLRKAEVESPGGRWVWKDPSGELTKVRKILSKEE